jgi:hypothetical protein
MKQIRPLSFLLFNAIIFLLISCGGNEEKTSTETTTTTTDTMSTTTTPTTTPAQSTIDTTRETIMVVRHRISNYAKWKPSYDEHDSMRLANGLQSYVIGRGLGKDSNTVLVTLKADDVKKAKAFSKNASLKTAMQKSGVVGAPTFRYFTAVYQDNAKSMSDTRSMRMLTVKDWDTWKTSFENNRQLRIDNGLTDRAYGYDPDNNKKVIVVYGINDTAKANSFWKSDIMKQNMEKAGVIGQPERFDYQVQQRYY